jgi:hypothetical protein
MAAVPFTDMPVHTLGSVTLHGHWTGACTWCGTGGDIDVRFLYGQPDPAISGCFTRRVGEVSGSHSCVVSVSPDQTLGYWFSTKDWCCAGGVGWVNGELNYTKTWANADSHGTPTVLSVTQTTAQVRDPYNPNTTESSATLQVWYRVQGVGSFVPGATSGAQSGTSTRNVDLSITGLLPGTTYEFYFRSTRDTVNAQSSDSAIGTFTTLPAQTVVTNAASGIGPNDATLNGTVNPGHASNAVSYYFQWGTTTGYGSTTATQGPSSGTSPVPFSAAIGGLTPAQEYHFRAVATTVEWTVYGDDQNFTAGGSPGAGRPHGSQAFGFRPGRQ